MRPKHLAAAAMTALAPFNRMITSGCMIQKPIEEWLTRMNASIAESDKFIQTLPK